MFLLTLRVIYFVLLIEFELRTFIRMGCPLVTLLRRCSAIFSFFCLVLQPKLNMDSFRQEFKKSVTVVWLMIRRDSFFLFTSSIFTCCLMVCLPVAGNGS